MSKPLNDQQQVFIKEYLKDRNATQAAIRAGYSERTAGTQGQRLLQHDEIKVEIQKGLDKIGEKLEVNATRVLAEMANIAFINPADILSWTDNQLIIKDSAEIPKEIMAAISEVSRNSAGTLKVKFYDKRAALNDLAKHFGLFEADNEQRNRDARARELAASDVIDAMLEKATPEQLRVLNDLFDGDGAGEAGSGQTAN